MKILADTNILARLAQPSHHQHVRARQALENLRSARHQLCIVPQVIYELWVLSTRPTTHNGLGLAVPETWKTIVELKVLFSVFRDERAILHQWEQLVVEHEVKGKSAHDARLVAAMYRHGLTHILTFNQADFARYPNITVLAPDLIVSNSFP